MHSGPRRSREANASIVVCALASALASCTFGATEVLIQVDSDIAPGRPATLDVFVFQGTSVTARAPTRTWHTDDPEGGLALPASFAIVPPHDGPRDGTVTLVAQLSLPASGPNEPAVSLRRTARFRFTARHSLVLPIFLPIACSAAATGCTTVSSDACTLATRCEELGMTCGNEARCIPIDTIPIAAPSDASTIPLDRMDAYTPPPPPRPIAPLSNTFLTAGSVVFTYALPPGADGARIELCASRACDTITRTIDADGTSSAPVTDLAPGLHWYRVRSRAEGAFGPPGVVWPFRTLHGGSATARHAYALFDLDGDGFDDTAVGNPMTSEVRVYRGGSSGFGATAAQTLHDAVNADFGHVIAAGSDVNGDGFGDLVVSSPDTSHVMVFHGSASGLASTPNLVLPDARDAPQPGFGIDIASAGDVDGDGYADLIVGTGYVSTVVWYRGGPNGIVTPAAGLLHAPDNNARFGTSLAGAGDMNGDGFADVLIGAWGAAGEHGWAYVFAGSATGLGATPWATMQGDTADDHFGDGVTAAGDVDADGFADVLVSAAALDRATLFRGGSSALAANPQVIRPPSSVMQFARFAISCAPAGDFDGDGFADVAVGAQDISRVYVFAGSATGLAPTPADTLVSNSGTNSSGFGRSVGGGGDCNGDARGDVIVGSTIGDTAWAYYGRAPSPTELVGDRYWTGPTNFGFDVMR